MAQILADNHLGVNLQVRAATAVLDASIAQKAQDSRVSPGVA
jgi:hypothetical protein